MTIKKTIPFLFLIFLTLQLKSQDSLKKAIDFVEQDRNNLVKLNYNLGHNTNNFLISYELVIRDYFSMVIDFGLPRSITNEGNKAKNAYEDYLTNIEHSPPPYSGTWTQMLKIKPSFSLDFRYFDNKDFDVPSGSYFGIGLKYTSLTDKIDIVENNSKDYNMVDNSFSRVILYATGGFQYVIFDRIAFDLNAKTGYIINYTGTNPSSGFFKNFTINLSLGIGVEF